MARSTLFNIRVLRCPNCSATLPFESGADMVTCEYCDAHIHVARSKAPATAPATAPPPTRTPETPSPVIEYTAQPRTSPFGWLLFTFALMFGISGAVFMIISNTFEKTGMWELLESAKTKPVVASSQLGTPPETPEPPPPTKRKASKSKKKRKAKAKSTAKADEAEGAEPGGQGTNSTKIVKKVAVRPAPPPEPTGPVLSVSDAEKALEPKVRACMREQGVHDILAYMGNSKVGPAKVLSDSRSRVDGVRAKVKGTALGKCMDKAGASIRVRAFKSNYLRFATVNESVPDPLAALPAKADRAEFERIIATVDEKVRACGKKHGEEGAKEVFYFSIDGPSGRATSVRGSYLSRGFKKCAEPIYEKLEFPKVRQWTIKITKHLQL